MAPEPEQHSQ